MRGENPHPHQAGNGSQTASSTVHVVHTPPREDLFSLSTCPDKISQQSHRGPGDIIFSIEKGPTWRAFLLRTPGGEDIPARWEFRSHSFCSQVYP
jgi:hypothetical protein